MARCCFPDRPAPAARAPLVVAATAAAAAAIAVGCDASYQGFLDGVPLPAGDPSGAVQVYLGIDGLSREVFDRARARGAFADWNAADLVTPFPGTSDYAWTRTLRAGSIGGYEIEYFDPDANQVVGGGVGGIAEHILREGIASTYPCYQRFDFLGDGLTWQARSYTDPLGALTGTLDQLFDVVAGRARTQRHVLAYLINVDVVSHIGGIDLAETAVMEIDRRIRAFRASQQQPMGFTIFSDHGNAHLPSQLIEPSDILRDAGIAAVTSLHPPGSAAAPAAAAAPLEAVPIVHTRVSYVALHTHRARAPEIASLTSKSPYVELAVSRLEPDGAGAEQRFGVFRRGERHVFRRAADGTVTVEDPGRWGWLEADLAAFVDPGGSQARLADGDALLATLRGPYPDIFHRVATAFTDPAARYPADVIWSMPDDVASIGFEIPAVSGIRANDGFHGNLGRRSSLAALASDTFSFPPAVRSDSLLDLLPALSGR
jgi:hypothetical protein